MPDLRRLRTFVAVAEQRSFTRAGEVVHLKQQSVSKAVRELERELGVELLERTTREVRLTEAGRVLLEEGKRALEVGSTPAARASSRSSPTRCDQPYTPDADLGVAPPTSRRSGSLSSRSPLAAL